MSRRARASSRKTMTSQLAAMDCRAAEAEELHRQVLRLNRRVHGDENQQTLMTMNNLGNNLRAQGKLREAVELYREALQIGRRVLGEENPTTFNPMKNLGWTLLRRGKLEEAEGLCQRALELIVAAYGEKATNAIDAMSCVASVLRDQGRLTEAERLFREILELRHEVLGEAHAVTQASLRRLANVVVKQGRLIEAEKLFRRLLKLRREVRGEAHLVTQASLLDLAQVLVKQGKVDEARPYFAERIKHRRRTAEQPDANAPDLNRYAWLLLTCEREDLRDPQAALSIAKRAVEMSGGDNATILDTLALAYQMTGDFDKAVETQRKAVHLLPPSESARRAELETRLAAFLREKGDDEAAESVLRKAVNRGQKEHGEKHAQLVRTMTDLALLLHTRARYVLHSQFCGELAQVREGSIPRGELGIANTVVYYTTELVKRQKDTEAVPLLRQVLEIRHAAYPQGDWRIAYVMSLLGAALVGQEKFTEAEPLLLEGYNQMNARAEKIPAYFRDARLREAVDYIVSLYEFWDAAEPDKGHDAKAAEWRAKLPKEEPKENK